MFGAESPKSCSYPPKHFNVCSLSSFGVRVSGALFIAQPSHPPPSSMDGATAGGGGGVTGPAPFLIKTYEMVDDSSTDEIVSWSSAKNSFVVWNPPEFARLLLPSYFKHNNFSSFIRQLNTYGFRKSDPERWEFANEDFVKDKKHLLKNIHRRKPVHSHSNPQGTLADAERAAFDGEIERLSREKDELQMKVFRFKQQQPAKLQLEELTHRVAAMERRQERLLTFFEKAVQNPAFIKSLAQKIESMDFSAYNKKRRLPQVDHLQPVAENSLLDNHSSSRPECGSIFHKDFSNKLKLELSPAASDINLLSQSTQSSNEDAGSPRMKISEGEPREAAMRTEGLSFAPETVELSDTGTSFTFKMDPNLSQRMEVNESQRLLCLQESLTSTEDGDGHISCHLNLTLASSPLQVDKSSSNRLTQMGQEIGKYPVPRSTADHKNRNLGADDTTLSSSPGASPANQAPLLAQGRVNDVFWEQFLTERPGSSDNEEASSNLRSYPYDEQEDRRAGQGIPGNSKTMEHLTL